MVASTAARTRLDLPWLSRRRKPALSTHEELSLGVLALLADPRPMRPLLQLLRQRGLQVDTAADLSAARRTFFGAGGHDCLVVAPDVARGLANNVAWSLGSVDPELAMATFGPDLRARSPARTARLAGFHPGSRAGQGALLRFLHTL